MLQKGSYINFSFSLNYQYGKIIHIYTGFKHNLGRIGNFIKLIIKIKNFILKGVLKSKLTGVIILTKFSLKYYDYLRLKCNLNSSILIKRRLLLYSKNITGICPNCINRKKIKYFFLKII